MLPEWSPNFACAPFIALYESPAVAETSLVADGWFEIAATSAAEGEGSYSVRETIDRERVKDEIIKLSTEMVEAAEALEFEKAASLRDRIRELESKL